MPADWLILVESLSRLSPASVQPQSRLIKPKLFKFRATIINPKMRDITSTHLPILFISGAPGMKKVLLCLGAVVLASCASHAPSNNVNEYSQNGATPVAPGYSPGAFQLLDQAHDQGSNRSPADAPIVKWEPTTFNYRVTSASMSDSRDVTVNQQLSWTEHDVPYDALCSRLEDVPDALATCTDVKCSGGSVKTEAWSKYLDSYGPEKTKALADAINGIGLPTAKALIEKGYFKRKPSSWEGFIAELRRAADAGDINKAIPYDVAKNTNENMANLGYGAGSCQVTTRFCQGYSLALVSYSCTKYRDVAKSRVADSKVFHVSVVESGAKLLPGESDDLSFSIDENGKVVGVDASGDSNNYSVTQTQTGPTSLRINVNQASRIARQLPNSVVQREQFSLVGTQPTFLLEIDPAYLPTAVDPGSQLVMDYTVRTCEYGWTGFCGFNWDDQKIESVLIKNQRVRLNVNLPKHVKAELTYSLRRIGSQYYSARPTEVQETGSKIKMPPR
jgi:hypothetical protein